MENIEIKFLRIIPERLFQKIDQLLLETESGNRIGDNSSLPKDRQDRLYNKHDRVGYVIAFDERIVVGIIIVFKREIQLHGEKLILGGIGGVCTKKEYRRRGIGTEMIKVAKKSLEDSACEVAFLRTDTQDPRMIKLYGTIGFVILGKPDTYRGKSGKQYTDKDGMIAPILSREKFQ